VNLFKLLINNELIQMRILFNNARKTLVINWEFWVALAHISISFTLVDSVEVVLSNSDEVN
jgi:hypothetical protein